MMSSISSASVVAQAKKNSESHVTSRRIRPGFLSLALLLLLVASCAGDVIDQLARQGTSLLTLAKDGNETIRQCDCSEQHDCVDRMETQGLDCVDTCWNKLSSLTKSPGELKKCFGRSRELMANFINCFEKDGGSCLQSPDPSVKIPKMNIPELIRLGTDKILKAKDQLVRSLNGPIVKVIETSVEFAHCVKACFLAKNANGFCFDEKKCQPLLTGAKTKKTLRQCIRIIDFKKEAGELCDCSVKAGLIDLEKYCPMLKLIGGRNSQRGKHPPALPTLPEN